MTSQQALQEGLVVSDPRISHGKPMLRASGIFVEDVIGHLQEDLDLEGLFIAFPQLTRRELSACLAYAWAASDRERIRVADNYWYHRVYNG